ncbi:putative bifunctional diguanylate cyclase/phosphodiesterase [Pseudonocardia acaciae]|uniref:putative bifunctional diguanylate cyclase/phosphodiesterase n=1 Tax=Pseudonocardia acaciae TaxID=551276 RepID=UPI0006878C69|nr:bifunctional diguanylate cyclase/phosphodiesterase [Pseudonocardia acaciae]
MPPTPPPSTPPTPPPAAPPSASVSIEALPLPSAPTMLCDAGDRVLRVNAALLRMAGRDPRLPNAADGIVGRPLSQLVVGPDGDARLVRPDGALARVRVVRWALPNVGPDGLRAVMLIDAAAAAPPVARRDDADREIAELQRLAKVGGWSYDLRTGALHRSVALVELYRDIGLEPDAQPNGSIELEQVAALCTVLRDQAAKPGDKAADTNKATDEHQIERRTVPSPHSPAGLDERSSAGRSDLGAGRAVPPSEHVLSCRATVERNAEGAPVRLVGTVQDVTERWVAEQRIGRATQRYLDLVSIAPVGVGVFNRTGHLVDANGALCALLGVSGERLRGVSARSLAVEPTAAGNTPQDGEDEELAFLRRPRPGGPTGYRVPQYAIRRADGTSVWCELSVTVSIGDDGRPFWLVVFTDISERRRAADVLRMSGTHDELTRLPNRSSVTARLGRLLAGPDRHKIAVLCCDLDDFKRVNTALGHAAGDQVLIMLAARLQRELPVGCSPARLSGDEFVVVCDDVLAFGGVPKLAETVSALLRGPVEVDGQVVRVSAAIGVATPADGDGRIGVTSAEDLLRFADAAMYDAKGRGAGQLGFVTAETATSANNQLRLEDELREAIATDGLALHYQPVVGPDGTVRSAEALIRWPHPERGMLFPGEFIPVAERGGLLRELDKWVLRTAAKEAAGWPAHNRRPVSVAVNLAGLLPGDDDFLPTVRTTLAESGLNGDRLVLELVETSLVSLPKRTLAAMSELAGLGVRFAVDDFGTGYSSLSRIKELPAQIVKVDRTFVSGISSDPADFAVARAVVQMASAMGRYCVAEGVETAEQFHALRGLGVDAYQGWLFAKAMDPSAFRSVLTGPTLPTPDGETPSPPDGMATQALPTGAKMPEPIDIRGLDRPAGRRAAPPDSERPDLPRRAAPAGTDRPDTGRRAATDRPESGRRRAASDRPDSGRRAAPPATDRPETGRRAAPTGGDLPRRSTPERPDGPRRSAPPPPPPAPPKPPGRPSAPPRRPDPTRDGGPETKFDLLAGLPPPPPKSDPLAP